MDEWHRQQILIRKEQKEWLDRESFTTKKSIGEIIREALDEYRKKRLK